MGKAGDSIRLYLEISTIRDTINLKLHYKPCIEKSHKLDILSSQALTLSRNLLERFHTRLSHSEPKALEVNDTKTHFHNYTRLFI